MTDDREVTCTEVLDVGQLDKVTRLRSWELEGADGHFTTRNQTRQDAIPEDLMAGLEDEIGDGLAKVTVGAELAHSKDYGCKAQAFVSISVHCNNDDDTIGRVHGKLHDKTRELANQDLKDMIADRDLYLEQGGQEAKPEGRMARKSGPAQASTKKAAPRPGVKPQGKVRARPNYKR